MSFKKSVLFGIILCSIISFNTLSFGIGLDAGKSVYLNKVAECTFEVGYRIKAENNIVYVSDNNGVLIIDVEDPTSPEKIGRIESSEAAFGITIVDDFIYIGSGSGLIIANVSNPSQPKKLVEYSGASGAFSIAVKDEICFIGYMENRLDIYNVSNPTNPVLLKQITTFGLDDIVIYNDLLYGADRNYGLRILNISDPVNPSFIKNINLPGATDISINNDLLYLGCHLYGIKTIDISNPTIASVIATSSEDDGGEAQGVVYAEGFLCVADNWGVEIFNISDPTSISKIDEIRQGISAAHDIIAIGNFVFVAKGFGLGIYEISNVKRGYFPTFLYYVIPISATVVIGLGLLIYFKKKK